MSNLELRPEYWAKLAATLREQIPHAAPEVAKPMIEAAGELQRVADEIIAVRKEAVEQLLKAAKQAVELCQCAHCTAKRAESKRMAN